MTIRGQGAATTVIDGGDNGDGDGLDRLFDLPDGGTLTLEDLTIQNGAADYGGGVYNYGGNLTLNDCTLSGNYAYDGGGVALSNGRATISGCTFQGNYAGYGGGIDSNGGNVTLTDSTLSGNYASVGGGLYHMDGRATISGCTFQGNYASLAGGGILNFSGSLTLSESVLSGNLGLLGGGGIFNGSPDDLPYDEDILESITTEHGRSSEMQRPRRRKAPFLSRKALSRAEDNPSEVSLTDCALQGNGGLFGGGGVLNFGGSVTLSRSLLSENAALWAGGGVLNFGGSVTLSHSLLSGNVALLAGGGLFNGFGLPVRPSNPMHLGQQRSSNESESTSSAPSSAEARQNGGYFSYALVANSTLSGNMALLGGGIANAGYSDDETSTTGAASSSESALVPTITSGDETKSIRQNGASYGASTALVNSTLSGNGYDPALEDFSDRSRKKTLSTAKRSSSPRLKALSRLEALSKRKVVRPAQENGFEPSGGALLNTGVVETSNTIFSGSLDVPNCFDNGTITSRGHNLSDDDSCGLTETGDRESTDPLLDELADNGGPTLTHALPPDSPALDAGDDEEAERFDLTTDQRGEGFPRFADGDADGSATTDIGAFEALPPLARDDYAGLNEGASVAVTVTDNDTALGLSDLDLSTLEIVAPPTKGTAEIAAPGVILYTHPEGNPAGPDTLEYTIKDSEGFTSNTATLFLTVNAPPVLRESYEPPPGLTRFGGLIGVLDEMFRDPEGGEVLFVSGSDDAGGEVAYDPRTGRITYTPPEGFFGPVEITITVEDEKGAAFTYTFSLNIQCDDICEDTQRGVIRLPRDRCFIPLGGQGEGRVDVMAMGVVMDVRPGGEPVTLTLPPGTDCEVPRWKVYDLDGNDITEKAGEAITGCACFRFDLTDEPGYYHVEAVCDGTSDEMYAFGVAVR